MKWRIIALSICWICLIASYRVQAQSVEADTVKVNELLAKSKELISNEPEHAVSLSEQAIKLAKEINFSKGVALGLKNIGVVYYTQTKYLEAINYWRQAMDIYKSMNDLVGVANILNNIGVIYSIQGDYIKALENYLASLKFAEQSNNKERISSALINIGATYALKPETYDKALEYYLRALPIAEASKDMNGIGTTSVNIGEVYSNKGNSALALQYFQKSLKAYQDAKDEVHIPYAYNAIAKEYRKQGRHDLALQFHQKALVTARKVDNKLYMIHSLIGLANTNKEKGLPEESVDFYKQAEALGREIIALDELKDIYQGLSASYATLRKYDKAFEYQSLYTGAKDSLYNIATDKKLARMEFDFNLQKKQGEINLLTRDQELKDLKLRKQKLAQNFLIVGLGMIFVIAFIIYRNYRAKVRINKVLDQQKDQIEHLLLNILPDEVAKELQDTGTATPRRYDNVSVLFTDFKGFSATAEKMSPEELVEELNVCFMAFDNIIEKHNLEKIKTIGDSYMCAGGIPVPDDDHPFRMLKAGQEMQDYVLKNNLRRKSKGLPPWDVRVGIHVGPVVAGVVGKKKYAYDIWGSTVNIASRMESNGAPGQINISAAMYDIIKDEYICSHRGKIYAKNVGEIDMYFVEQEIKIPVKAFQPDNLLQ